MNKLFLKNSTLDLDKIIIETPRCQLEPFRMEWIDFEDLQSAYVGANENQYIDPELPNLEEKKEFIAQSIEKRKAGKAFECYIFEKWSSTLIGAVGINSLHTVEPNIWIWIRKECHGQGFATEAYQWLLDWAKENTTFKFFKHGVNLANTASLRLAEKFNWVLQEERPKGGGLKYYIPVASEDGTV